MKQIRIFLRLAVLVVFAVAALGQGRKSAAAASAPQAQHSQPPPTIASTVDREISIIEKQIVEAAEAMPEARFNFSPESLNGDKIPEDFKGGNGPEDLKTKADIIKFLRWVTRPRLP